MLRFVVLSLSFVAGVAVVLQISDLANSANPVSSKNRPAQSGTAETTGFAVVELFTSQGCSSCPPADKVLQELNKRSQSSGEPIYCLSFHVDYWNGLGWDDPYSQAAFSNRQRAYAKAMNSTRIYTPQMIVNGTTEFVGSKSTIATRNVQQQLEKTSSSPSLAKIKLDAVVKSDQQSVDVDYTVEGQQENQILNLAVVEDHVSNQVPRGENANRQLAHDNVVRVFTTKKLDATGKGTITMKLPKDMASNSYSVVAYVQDKTTGEVMGASRVVADHLTRLHQ